MTVIQSNIYYISLEDCQRSVGGNGWDDLIERCYELCEQEPEDIYICQVKEKFGGLRFYILGGSDELQDKILEIEKESLTVCQKCGEKGKQRNTGWILTLCDKHFEEHKKEDKNAEQKTDGGGIHKIEKETTGDV